MNSAHVVIIPALDPDERLLDLVGDLMSLGQRHIAVVNDGSRAECGPLFSRLEKLGCIVYHHGANMGKGAAIKTGIRLVAEKLPGLGGYVTADADGQHRAGDIMRASETLDKNPGSIVLGVRDFSLPGVPRKRRFGNRFSALYFRLTTGVRCPDTQTGLRAFPAALKDFALAVPGDRYEYEMNFLTAAAKKRLPLALVPIETVYYRHDETSHFRAVADSFRIYKTPLKFAAVSLTCAGVDLAVFTLLTSIISTEIYALVLIATVAARLTSGGLNFFLNRTWSFSARQAWRPQAARYLALYLAIMLASWLLVWGFAFLPVPLTAVKAGVDGALFVASYLVQRHWVFPK